jgi:hypothetical protein
MTHLHLGNQRAVRGVHKLGDKIAQD